MRIADVLRNKGTDVATVGPSATVTELITALAAHNVGALPVVEGDELVGIVSERDVVRRLNDHGPSLLDATVSGIMSTGVTTCTPRDDVADIAAVMTTGRFRHLPVLVDGKLAGIVSIGDLVKARIDVLESERTQLRNYIAG
jgi:CBS domain-containing protein